MKQVKDKYTRITLEQYAHIKKRIVSKACADMQLPCEEPDEKQQHAADYA